MIVPGIEKIAKITPIFFCINALRRYWIEEDTLVENTAIKLVAEICEG